MNPHCHTASGLTLQSVAQYFCPVPDETRSVPFKEWPVVTTHRHAQIMGGLGSQTLRVNKLELARTGLERVPPMGVAVHQYGLHWVERRGSLVAVGQRAVDNLAVTWPPQVTPRRRNVFRQPLRLVDSSGQAAVIGQGPPERTQRGGDCLHELWKRQIKFRKVGPEPFEQDRRRGLVIFVEPRRQPRPLAS